MPKRTKQERQERRQHIVENIKTFIDKHDDKVLPILKTVVAKKFPVASMVVEAIKEARESKLPADTKALTVDALTELLAETDPDGSSEDDPARVINSTWVSKFITPLNMIFSSITFYGALATEILNTWGIVPVKVDTVTFATIAGVYGSLHGLNIWTRAEMKKTQLQS